jgi:hypothetical protein
MYTDTGSSREVVTQPITIREINKSPIAARPHSTPVNPSRSGGRQSKPCPVPRSAAQSRPQAHQSSSRRAVRGGGRGGSGRRGANGRPGCGGRGGCGDRRAGGDASAATSGGGEDVTGSAGPAGGGSDARGGGSDATGSSRGPAGASGLPGGASGGGRGAYGAAGSPSGGAPAERRWIGVEGVGWVGGWGVGGGGGGMGEGAGQRRCGRGEGGQGGRALVPCWLGHLAGQHVCPHDARARCGGRNPLDSCKLRP